MPEVKKTSTSATAKAAKPKRSKPKSVAPKAARKPKREQSAKQVVTPAKAPKAIGPSTKPSNQKKVRKPRGLNKVKAKGNFAELLKKQAELEEIKKGAKTELKKEYDTLLKDADKIKAQYKELFGESIESGPKLRRTRGIEARKSSGKIPGLRPYTLKEVESFIEQKQQGVTQIRVQGRRPKSLARMEDAFRHSEDAEEILKMLNH